MTVPEWSVQVIIGFAIFFITQTGVLIWFLSRINSEVKGLSAKVVLLDNITYRVSVLETRCKLFHNNRQGSKKDAPIL